MKANLSPRELFAQTLRYLALIALPLVGTTHAQFTPGEGGAISEPADLPVINGQFGTLFVERCTRENITFSSGTRRLIDLEFPPATAFGGTGYILQGSLDAQDWELVHTTSSASQDNFVFSSSNGFNHSFYRLVLQGGPRDGDVSNVVHASPLSQIDTWFSGWGLDESMWITGVMLPWVGRGLEASFSVKKLEDHSPINGGLSYQWYRLNPKTGEMTPIEGATELLYATTEDDLGGWHLVCRATGDQTTVGGFAQVRSQTETVAPNQCFASNVSTAGFTLNLYRSVPSLTVDHIRISYWDSINEIVVPVTGLTAAPGNASFDIQAALPAGVAVYVEISANGWSIVSDVSPDPEFEHLMQGLQVTAPAAGDPFNDWLVNAGIPADQQDPLDQNGPLMMTNLCAFAMGINPLQATPDQLPQIRGGGGSSSDLLVTYRRAKDLGTTTLTTEVSANLTQWQNATILNEIVLQDGGSWEVVECRISNEKPFFRLKALKP